MTRAKYIVGVDEVGRGPVAGPLCVCAVSVKQGFNLKNVFPHLTDSKKLSEKRREEIVATLLKGDVPISYALSYQSAEIIDTHGIEYALKSAVSESITALSLIPDESFIYLDGRLRAPALYEQETVIKGDSLIPEISLASIIAKVNRDNLMKEECQKFPEYGFRKHKGYGTKAHMEAIQKHGLSPLHRKTFLSRIINPTN